MSYADRITRKDQQSPVWVVEIAGGTSRWFSSIPLTAKSEAMPILAPVKLPASELPLTGGNSKVTSVSLTFLDIMAQGLPKASQYFYSRALVGSPVKIYFGYAVDTTWNSTNFPMLWAGKITDYQFSGKAWQVTCESTMADVKARPIPFSEFTADVATAITPNSNELVMKNVAGSLVQATPSTLIDGGDFEASGDENYWVSAHEEGGTAPVLSRSTAKKHAGSYSMEAVVLAADTPYVQSLTYTASGVPASPTDIPLPAGHKPGDSYTVVGWWASAIDASEVNPNGKSRAASIAIYGVTGGGTIQEYGVTPGGFKQTGASVTWSYVSATVTVFHPDTTHLRVKWEFKCGGIFDYACSFYFDDFAVYPVSQFLAVDHEVLPVISYAEGTCTATIGHGALGTVASAAAVDSKVRKVFPLAGFGGDIALRVLTTTSTRDGNGDYDYGDGYGVGVLESLVDVSAFEALRTAYPYHTYMAILDREVPDTLKWLDEEILSPWGITLGIGNRGLIKPWVLPENVSSPSYTITDAKLVGSPSVKCDAGSVINTVYAQTDYDHMSCIDTARYSEPALEKAGAQTKGKSDRDPKFVGVYALDEENYHTDYIYRDQNKSSQSVFGERPYAWKSKSVRGVYSSQMSMPFLQFNYPDTGTSVDQKDYLLQRGEYMVRHLATRLLTYYNTPVYTVTFKTQAWAMDVEPGEVLTMSTDYLPDLDPSTGGRMGFSGVAGFVVSKTVSNGEVTLGVVMADWASTIPTDQPAYSYSTNPSGTYLGFLWATYTDFTTCSYECLPLTNTSVIRIVHKYDGSTNGTMPTENAYARTETRRYLNKQLDYCVASRSSTSGIAVSGLAVPSMLQRFLGVAYIYKDATYSTVHTSGSV